MHPVQPEKHTDMDSKASPGDKKLPGSSYSTLPADPRSSQKKDQETDSGTYFESVFRNSIAGMVITDLQGVISQANHTFSTLTGYSEGELAGMQLTSLIHPSDTENYSKFWNHLLSNDEEAGTIENRYLNKSEGEVWARNNLSALKDKEGNYKNMLIISINIQDEKRALYKAEEVAKRFRMLADSMPQQIWTADAAGNLNYFSHAFYDYSGLTPQDIKNGKWPGIVFPEDKENTDRLWQLSMETGEEFVIEHRLRRRDGNYKWQLSRAMAQRDHHGKIVMWVGATTNIHNQKTLEGQLEKQVLERTRDLEEANFNLKHSNHDLEQFAYIATHDLQEPLRKIRTYSSWINKKFAEDMPEEAHDYMMKIENASERMSKLIDDLLNYSLLLRPQEAFEMIDLDTILDQVLVDFDEVIADKHAVIERLPLPKLKVVPMQIHQLFYNLISNALKFSSDRETVIKITTRELSEEEIMPLKLDMDLRYMEIAFMDNGIGFSQEYAEKVFVIFQRLHNRVNYSGTGIGLALCQKIVHYHHGLMYAFAKENEGASFYIVLPLGSSNSE
jgi:PAS domain S-box-containing protein